jgi:hypothetical protein
MKNSSHILWHVINKHKKENYNYENISKKRPKNIIWPIFVPWLSFKGVPSGSTQSYFHPLVSLGFVTKARACKVAGQEEAQEWRKVWGNEPSHSQRSFHFGSLESRWIPELIEGDCRGRNLMDWGVLYVTEKLLKCKCLKWARMTHLDI